MATNFATSIVFYRRSPPIGHRRYLAPVYLVIGDTGQFVTANQLPFIKRETLAYFVIGDSPSLFHRYIVPTILLLVREINIKH